MDEKKNLEMNAIEDDALDGVSGGYVMRTRGVGMTPSVDIECPEINKGGIKQVSFTGNDTSSKYGTKWP